MQACFVTIVATEAVQSHRLSAGSRLVDEEAITFTSDEEGSAFTFTSDEVGSAFNSDEEAASPFTSDEEASPFNSEEGPTGATASAWAPAWAGAGAAAPGAGAAGAAGARDVGSLLLLILAAISRLIAYVAAKLEPPNHPTQPPLYEKFAVPFGPSAC